jgi:hypothetical protein
LGGATNFPQRAALAFTPLKSTKVELIGAHHLCRKLQSQGHNARFLSVHGTVRLQQLRYGVGLVKHLHFGVAAAV